MFHYGLILGLPTFAWLFYLFRRSYRAFKRAGRAGAPDVVALAMLCTVVNLLVTAVVNSYMEFSPVYSVCLCHALGIEGASLNIGQPGAARRLKTIHAAKG